VSWPARFDLVRAVEMGNAGNISMETLVSAETRECERLLNIYQATLARATSEENAAAPIHQLFWHRISGGRFSNYYPGKFVRFPIENAHHRGVAFDELLEYHWVINYAMQRKTLGELVAMPVVVLDR